MLGKTQTILVFKEPKTKTFVRKVFLPSTVAQMFAAEKKKQEEYKELLGDEYMDYNLVFCFENGRPIEAHSVNKKLDDFIKKNDLPKIVFHSFRHSGITYKLKLNGGDMKAVTGSFWK